MAQAQRHLDADEGDLRRLGTSLGRDMASDSGVWKTCRKALCLGRIHVSMLPGSNHVNFKSIQCSLA